MDDESLADAIKGLTRDAHDAEAWATLYHAVYPYLMTLIYRSVGGNRHLAEEGAQEVMLRVLRHLDAERSGLNPATLTSYFKLTARSVVVDIVRRERNRGRLVSFGDTESTINEPSISDPSPEEGSIIHSGLRGVRRKLSDRERRVFDELIGGKGIEEIAKLMSLSKRTVENYVCRIRGQMRDSFIRR